MKKVKFLARKLKAFSFNDIFSLAEMPREELQEKLNKLVEENILKNTAQGYIYCEFYTTTNCSDSKRRSSHLCQG